MSVTLRRIIHAPPATAPYTRTKEIRLRAAEAVRLAFAGTYQPVERPQTHREWTRLAHLNSIKIQRYSRHRLHFARADLDQPDTILGTSRFLNIVNNPGLR